MTKENLRITLIGFLIFIQAFCCVSYSNMSSSQLIQEKDIDVKDDSLLLCIAQQIVERNKNLFPDKINSAEYIMEFGQPLHIVINQVDDFHGAKRYSFYISTYGISKMELPTFLEKRKNVFVMAFLKNRQSLQKKSIPNYFFETPRRTKDGYIIETAEMIIENSWMALICKDTRRVVVVEDTFLPFETIVQFQTFDCGKIDYNNGIKIEHAIVDTALFNKLVVNRFTKNK